MTTKTTEKNVNYTEEMTKKVLSDYAAGVSPEAIAVAVGKTARSVVAKLSREGVYKPKAKEGAKAPAVGKADMAATIAKVAALTADEAKDLQKLTKQTLVNLVAFVEKVEG